MQFEFYGLKFEIKNKKIRLTESGATSLGENPSDLGVFGDAQVAGENRVVCFGSRRTLFSEWTTLSYAGHGMEGRSLWIEQKNERIRLTTFFDACDEGRVIRVRARAENISSAELVLEAIPVLSLFGLFGGGVDYREIFLYRFYNSWHVECQPKCHSLFEEGLTYKPCSHAHNRVFASNTGGWSTQEELPQAILEDRRNERFLMFQIESSCDWYWEIAEAYGSLYLTLGGADEQLHQWRKRLQPGEYFDSVCVAVCTGDSLHDVTGAMTRYRRENRIVRRGDSDFPVIFNEYMFLSWDNPCQDRIPEIARSAKELGCEVYVLDCGWHDEEDSVYPYVGKWRESNKRFPAGLKETADTIHSLGMKFGLWLEPESFGRLCEGMEEVYDDECFFVRNGGRVCNMNRYQLDFRSPKVRAYLDGVIDGLVRKYGVDYLKLDYNQNCGTGTELNADSLGDGLVSHSKAFLSWVDGIFLRHPDLIIECCASGGQRMDSETLRHFSLQSTSDQTDYRLYPYIVANVLSAVLPEQAAAWSYPAAAGVSVAELPYSCAYLSERVDAECVVSNMVNSLLGRIHLASHVEMLSESHRALIREGIRYYRGMSDFRRSGEPFWPTGFAAFGDKRACAGIRCGNRLCLAVWNTSSEIQNVHVPLEKCGEIFDVRVGYPVSIETKFEKEKNGFSVCLPAHGARLFEIDFTGTDADK